MNDSGRSLVGKCLAEAAAIEGVERDACERLLEKWRNRSFDLVVAGQFKRGKSSLVNALVGAPVLPVGVVPLTSAVTILEYGEGAWAEIAFAGGKREEVPLGALPEYVTESRNPGNVKRVAEAKLHFPSDWLRDGNRLVDTPGIGSVYDHNTETALRYVPRADAVLFVASADQPMSRAETEFLKDVRQYAPKVFCLLNKADYLEPAELGEALEFATRAVREALQADVPVFPLSAKLALQGKLGCSRVLLERSGFSTFDQALRSFLEEEKEAVWLRSLEGSLLRILEESRLRNELEHKALSEPLAALEEKLARVEAKKRETGEARAELELLLDGQVRELLKQRVEPELEQFKRRLRGEIAERLREWFEELQDQPLRALAEQVRARTVEQVRGACDAWRAAEDAALGPALEALFERHAQRVQSDIDELARYCADLFDIPYEAVATKVAWEHQAQFAYKFWDAPGSLYLLSSALTEALPRFLASRQVRNRLSRSAADLIEVQSGRMRHDFEQRLKRSAAEFRAAMLRRIDATSAGIEAAIERGASLRKSGDAAAARRRAVLRESSAAIAGITARLCTPTPRTAVPARADVA